VSYAWVLLPLLFVIIIVLLLVVAMIVVIYDMLRGRARVRKMKGMEVDDEVSEEVGIQFKEENHQENK